MRPSRVAPDAALNRWWLVASLLLSALVVAGLLVLREANYREGSVVLSRQPAMATVAPVAEPFSSTALVLAFGFNTAEAGSASALQLTLKACFTSSQGEARALVSAGDGDVFYQVGDRLPGGAVLRRIDGQSITLWFNGGEQRVSLAGSASPVFRLIDRAVPTVLVPPPSSHLLRKVP